MKKVLALFAFVLALSVNASFAQTVDNNAKATPASEQAVTPAATHSCGSATTAKAGACCASHGAKAEAKDDASGVKTASTTHEHAGKTCDPAHCTEADKKACAGAKGKSCCMSTAAAAPAEKETPKP